jgi:hypothetical protein
MRAALEIFEYNNTYHFDQVITNIRESDRWPDLLDAKFGTSGQLPGRLEFDHLLGRFQAVTDAPCNIVYAKLIAAHPDAKVILVKRPFEAWFTSFQVVIDGCFAPSFILLARLDPGWMGRL